MRGVLEKVGRGWEKWSVDMSSPSFCWGKEGLLGWGKKDLWA